MATDRKATAVWSGDLPTGKGTAKLESSGLGGELPVSWPSRTEEPGGQTSPEELIAAAHAACYSMALSNVLAQAGTPPEKLETSATVTFDLHGGPHISKVALTVRGTVPGADADAFADAAGKAKDGCPVSKALAGNVEISVEPTLA